MAAVARRPILSAQRGALGASLALHGTVAAAALLPFLRPEPPRPDGAIVIELAWAAWRVVKPTEDGAVTSIELLDAAGEVVALLFGARKPGQTERDDWRGLVAEVAARHALPAETAA